jgi:hypothetical protein
MADCGRFDSYSPPMDEPVPKPQLDRIHLPQYPTRDLNRLTQRKQAESPKAGTVLLCVVSSFFTSRDSKVYTLFERIYFYFSKKYFAKNTPKSEE